MKNNFCIFKFSFQKIKDLSYFSNIRHKNKIELICDY